MVRNTGRAARWGTGPIDCFISYTPADVRWATWIAWQLESAGYSTVIQAWDFVPGVPFIDWMDRALREARLVVGVLTPRYQSSDSYSRREWQAAMQRDADKLVTVLVEECTLDGLLTTVTFARLVGLSSEDEARAALLAGVRHALEGRAKPAQAPEFPPNGAGQTEETPPPVPAPSRRIPAAPPVYPPRIEERAPPRETLGILHVPGPRFGREVHPVSPRELQSRVWADVTMLADQGAPAPDLVIVSGDLMASARPRQVEAALEFLTGVREMLKLEPGRVIIVPGSHDVSRAACRSYLAHCEARDREPQLPYYPKFEFYAELFAALYHGVDGVVFDVFQPWTLFDVSDLHVVVAGLNSTMAIGDREAEDYGWIGEEQATWFANALRRYEETGWLRIGVMRHVMAQGGGPNGADPALLRDAGTFDRLLGRRLNLLIHGHGPARPGTGDLRSDLAVLAAAGPDRHEIVEVTADGMRRWSPDSERPASGARRWHACEATFAGSGTTTGPSEPPDPRPPLDPTSLLLERITEVCRARDEEARVRRIDGLKNQLLVTSVDGGIVTLRRIGAIVGTPTPEDLEVFLASDPEPGSELVYLGPATAPAELREEALRRSVRLRSFTEFQGLLDLSGYVTRQTTQLRSNRLYSPDLYVPQRFRELDRADAGMGDDIASELMRLVSADHSTFALILGDFGRGKTFLLRELTRRIAERLPHLVPILIELRNLDKAHSVEGLVAAHLANSGTEKIDLRAFRYMLHQGRVVLLFDGFDELVTRVTYDRATEHLDTLLRAAEGEAKIILSSRTQHFQSNAQVMTALGERVGLLHQRRILAVEDFSRDQIRRYLRNRYGSGEVAERRFDLISGVQDLIGLSQNPRMLSFIAELDERRLRSVARGGSPVSAAGLYQEILNSWLTHEATRAHGEAGTLAGLPAEALWHAVTVLAQRLWAAGEPFLRLEDIAEVAGTLGGLTEVPLTPEQAVHAVGAGSLLVRTEEGAFGFIHESVAEWLVASEVARQMSVDPAGHVPQLVQRPLSPLTVEFLCDLAGVQPCQTWANRTLSSSTSGETARTNAMRITGRLRTSPGADLRGASLHGEDLSGRSFQGVDLTGADLTDARLVGANLTRATLRDARLVGARLDEADLTAADLTNADLTRARLARANLSGVSLAGSRWNLAALIDTTGLPATELRGAAITPGQELVTVFAPAEIGVRHGFHPGVGRLPESIAYSHDGGTLAIGSDDGGVLVCETANGRPVRNLQGHRGRVFAVRYSLDDRLLVTGASDADVRVWDAATGACLHVLSGHEGWAWPVVVGPSGDVLASGDATGLLRLWSTDTGAPLLSIPRQHGIVYTAAFHPEGRLLAAGYQDGTVHVWDTVSGQSVADMHGQTGSVFRVAFDPSGATLAVAEAAGSLWVWEPHHDRPPRQLIGHEGSVYTVAHHPTSPLLASGDTRGAVRLWSTATGECRAVLEGHEAPIYWVAFNPAGDLLASGDGAGQVRLWDAASGDLEHALSGHSGSVWPFAFRPDGAQLAISDDQYTIRLWDPSRGQTQHLLTGHGRQVTSVAFGTDGETLATSGNDGVIRLWNRRTGQLKQTLIGAEERLITLQSAAFAPGGRLLATVSNDGRINLLNLETGRHERHINVESPPVWALAFSPTGDSIATADDDDAVRIWWRHNGRLVHELKEHGGRVRSIAFHPTAAVVATGSYDQKVRLWSTENGELIATLDGHSDRVHSVSFSSDGSLLASASWDGSIRVWSSEGEPLHELREHTGRLYAVAFAPAGTMLASAGDDLVIRLWDASTGEQLNTLIGHSRRVWSLSFSPDGSALASAGDDGTARLWSLGAAPDLIVTLIGRRDGWAAIALDGRYKVSGDVGDQFWHSIGMCRFDPGELDAYLPAVRHLAMEAEF